MVGEDIYKIRKNFKKIKHHNAVLSGMERSGMSDLKTLLSAVSDYHKALLETNKCAELLLSCGTDPRPAQIMQEMYEAQHRMFRAAELINTDKCRIKEREN